MHVTEGKLFSSILKYNIKENESYILITASSLTDQQIFSPGTVPAMVNLDGHLLGKAFMRA